MVGFCLKQPVFIDPTISLLQDPAAAKATITAASTTTTCAAGIPVFRFPPSPGTLLGARRAGRGWAVHRPLVRKAGPPSAAAGRTGRAAAHVSRPHGCRGGDLHQRRRCAHSFRRLRRRSPRAGPGGAQSDRLPHCTARAFNRSGARCPRPSPLRRTICVFAHQCRLIDSARTRGHRSAPRHPQPSRQQHQRPLPAIRHPMRRDLNCRWGAGRAGGGAVQVRRGGARRARGRDGWRGRVLRR